MSDFQFESIPDKDSFIQFVKFLHLDYLKNTSKWENKTLPDFLEAMARYSKDIQGYYDNTNQKIDSNLASWRVFADILKGASIYE